MAYENLKLVREEQLALLTVDRPAALNALNAATLRELSEAVDEVGRWAAADVGLRALVVTGGGEKAFVAGADIAEMAQFSPAQALAFASAGHRVGNQLEALPIPTLAAVNGYALGGGCELAMACDLVVASEKAKFGQPEVALGVIPGFGGTTRLVRRVGVQRARELVFTGDTLSAQGALELGLVVAVVPPELLLERCRDLVRRIAQKGPLAIAQAKRVMRASAELPLDVANAFEVQAFAGLFGSADQREGMAAFLQKRPARFLGL